MLIKVEGKKAGMFVKEEVFHQGDIHHGLKDEEETLPWTVNASQTLCTQGLVLLYKHCSYPRAKHTTLTSRKKKPTCAANIFHSWGILKIMFVYKVTFSKLHGCHCTLFKLLHSGVDVTMPKGCVSPPWMFKHSS